MVWERIYLSSSRIKAVNGGKSIIAIPNSPHCYIEYPEKLVKKTRLKSVKELIYGYNYNNFKVIFDDDAGEKYITRKEFESYFTNEHIKMHDKLFAKYER